MKKLFTILAVLAVLVAMIPVAVSAAPALPVRALPVLMTIHNSDPDFLVTVWSIPTAKCTTFGSRPFGVTKDVGPGPYRIYGGDGWVKDLWVLDADKNYVASSWWPGRPYTAHQALVPLPGEYWVMEQIVPQPNSNVQITDHGAGNLTLGIPDPAKIVVVKAKDGNLTRYFTFHSRPAGVTKSVPAGPYVFNGGNSAHFNMLVFDLSGKLVASSWWPGEPFTRGRATVEHEGAYYVFEQYVPSNVPNR